MRGLVGRRAGRAYPGFRFSITVVVVVVVVTGEEGRGTQKMERLEGYFGVAGVGDEDAEGVVAVFGAELLAHSVAVIVIVTIRAVADAAADLA